MQDIAKKFSGVYALSGITFDLYRPEIHCLVGKNKAGKSTLMKVLSGTYAPSGGKICVDGRGCRTLTPILSKELRADIVYQEDNLVPSMNVVENVYVGDEVVDRFGLVNFKAMLEETRCQMEDLKIHTDPLTKIESLSVSNQQFVKILKALSIEPRVLIIDEPTSMFNVEDAAEVLQLVQTMVAKEIGTIYISHYPEEVQQIAGRITVIHGGTIVNTYENTDKDAELSVITRGMVGRPVDTFYQKEGYKIEEVMPEVRDLQLKKEGPKVSFAVRKGEVLRFTGMVGVGRTEIAGALAGVDPKYRGDVLINGKKVVTHDPREDIEHRFAHITEGRQGLGLMLHISVPENATVVGLGKQIKGFLVDIKKYPCLIELLVQKLRIKTLSARTKAVYLPGRDQQRAVLAKWLFAQQKIYIFDEPTKGIDMSAKVKLRKQMSELTKWGKCITMASSDMPELISMSSRVLVTRNGVIDSELTGEQIMKQEIAKRALRVGEDEQ